MNKIRRALISVSNKDGLVDLARGLVEQGVEILSSGGTAALLRDNGLGVKLVSDYTGFPEILDGRVKTLHPRIFAGILARPTEDHRGQLEKHEIDEIDLVVVNLYPFEQTVAGEGVSVADAVEQIDIGGPSLVRAAAKNYERVAVVVDPGDYPVVLEAIKAHEGGIDESLRRRLAGRAFAHTGAYDAAIAGYFSQEIVEDAEQLPEVLPVALRRVQSLRYGENPHQQAAFYAAPARFGDRERFEQLGGKALSYNNLLDVGAAWALACDLPRTGVCVIKHTNPCGAAWLDGGDVAEVFRRAKATDPVSAFGGIVACNVPVTPALAAELKEMFLEVVVAPEYEPDALALLKKKKKLRLLQHKAGVGVALDLRSAAGGLLVQQADRGHDTLDEAKVVTKREPTAVEQADLALAWKICKHVKSNAIIFVKDGQLLGVGAGQMSRVDSVKLAVTKAELPLDGSVIASDAFFPFRDGLDAAVAAGACAVVEPGGSIRDKEVIAAADERGVAMLFTGTRHFRH